MSKRMADSAIKRNLKKIYIHNFLCHINFDGTFKEFDIFLSKRKMQLAQVSTSTLTHSLSALFYINR